MNNTIAYIKQALGNHFQPEEVRSLTHLILKDVCNFEPHQILLHKDKELSEVTREQIRQIVNRLLAYEPIQYILGSTSFYGYSFKVTPAVLIPRPETEELVDLIVHEEHAENLRLLDIGTGSGCIAISLAKQLKQPVVSALDISEKALEVAKSNADANQADVRFIHRDILSSDDLQLEKQDVIVSNPPYVMNREMEAMKQNVLDYEPHNALFVPDEDPLLFYRTIALFGIRYLKEGGRLYFEINAALGQETKALISELGYRDCILSKDLSQRDRIIKATR